MTTHSNLALPVGPEAIRVFCGYRADSLKERQGDSDEEKTKKRQTFFRELGHTFMPGTPLMQAPLGLSAYLPAVLDPYPNTNYPDEIAIIVYASLEIYQEKRSTSLSRRMYTRSHAAVFNMDQSRAQFPGKIDNPSKLEKNGTASWACFLYDQPIDWQDGFTRILFITKTGSDDNFYEEVFNLMKEAKGSLSEAGYDQLISVATSTYVAFWLHSMHEIDNSPEQLGIVPTSSSVMRDLTCNSSTVRGDEENGVEITGPTAYCFRFSRDLRFFT